MGNERVQEPNSCQKEAESDRTGRWGTEKGKKGLEKKGESGKLKESSSCFSDMGLVIEYHVRAPSFSSDLVQAVTKQGFVFRRRLLLSASGVREKNQRICMERFKVLD